MKKSILTFFTLCLFTITYAQKSGIITYTEKVVFEIKSVTEKDGEEQTPEQKKRSEDFRAMMPKDQSFQKELRFIGNLSLYQDKKGDERENLNMETDDGSFRIVFLTDETEDILYCDFAEKTKTYQTGIMGKSFTIEDELNPIKWKLTGEKIKYLDYECMKAVYEDTEKEKFIVAWFAPQIPVQAGPDKYHSLPGAVLMVNENDGKKEIRATKIELLDAAEVELTKPSKGKKVSQKEFNQIEEEKIKEMIENSQNARRKQRRDN